MGERYTSAVYELICLESYVQKGKEKKEEGIRWNRKFELSLKQKYLRVTRYQYFENDTIKQSEKIYQRVTSDEQKEMRGKQWTQVKGDKVGDNAISYTVYEKQVQKNNCCIDYYGIKIYEHGKKKNMIYGPLQKESL